MNICVRVNHEAYYKKAQQVRELIKQDFAVAFETVDGTAKAGSDYIPQLGRLEWADGDATTRTITLELIDDSNAAVEHFTLRLMDPTGGAMLTSSVATVWMADRTLPPPPPPPPAVSGGGGGAIGLDVLLLFGLLNAVSMYRNRRMASA